MNLCIAPDGCMVAIYDEAIDLRTLGHTTITRASHVEPDETGRWFAQIIDGPTLGPFAKRSEALTAEADWLIEHRLRMAGRPIDSPESVLFGVSS